MYKYLQTKSDRVNVKETFQCETPCSTCGLWSSVGKFFLTADFHTKEQ